MAITMWRDPDRPRVKGDPPSRVGAPQVGGLQIGSTTKMGKDYTREAEAKNASNASGGALEPSQVFEAPAAVLEPVEPSAEAGDLTCTKCGKVCKSAFGKQAHMRMHT